MCELQIGDLHFQKELCIIFGRLRSSVDHTGTELSRA